MKRAHTGPITNGWKRTRRLVRLGSRINLLMECAVCSTDSLASCFGTDCWACHARVTVPCIDGRLAPLYKVCRGFADLTTSIFHSEADLHNYPWHHSRENARPVRVVQRSQW